MCWAELACSDVHEARRFYRGVFGWEPDDRSHHSPDYTEWKLGDHSVAGLVPLEECWPSGVPSHWIPYFQVSDCDDAAALAADLGGRVHVPPTDGRFCVLIDLAGADFAVTAPAPSP